MGTGCFGDIVPALEQVMEGRECRHFADINGPVEELPRVLSTPGTMPICGLRRGAATAAPIA